MLRILGYQGIVKLVSGQYFFHGKVQTLYDTIVIPISIICLQVSVPVGDNTCEMKLNTTQATVVEDENLLVA